MLHVVFSKEDEGALRTCFELDEAMQGEILAMEQDWSIGPILGSVNSEGETMTRDEWMARAFKIRPPDEDPLERIKKYLKDTEETEEEVWIWIAPNARDVCGYYHLVSALESFVGRVYTLWLNNLPFINEKGQIFYPVYLSEIAAREFVKAKRLAQQISPAIFETDPDEWKRLKQEHKVLRILEGAKKISAKPETYFDKELKQQIGGDWQKCSKVIAQVMAKSKDNVSRQFLLWRLRECIQANDIEARGDWPDSEQFDIKKVTENTPAAHE